LKTFAEPQEAITPGDNAPLMEDWRVEMQWKMESTRDSNSAWYALPIQGAPAMVDVRSTWRSPMVHNVPNQIALIFGNEVKGLSRTALEHCHACVEVPSHGSKESLNVAVCAGMVLFALQAQH